MSQDLRIGEWMLQPELLQLTGPTTTVHLEPRSLAVLLDLAHHVGEVRSRRQLLDTVWGDAAVGEAALTHCIWELRSAFDDDARKPRVIQTVPRRGYRLIAPVSLAAAEPSEDGGDARAALDWRPAPDLRVPGRPHWRLKRRLGCGGFGETWLALHEKTGEPRVFKFCARARLRSLQREITLFRLLKETLGERRDITRILDWNFDHPPYFIESRYTAGGTLSDWAEAQGGLARVPLETRLELVAQVAVALAAAHSVGVLHKDVKPGNVLISVDDGEARAQLNDFGIGLITDRERLAAADITVLGWTEDAPGAGSRGSTSAGTPLYRAPELLEGKPPTLQADIYALGVLLYQSALGDFSRALAPGWRDEIGEALAGTNGADLRGEDVVELLVEDIEAAVQGAPERRLRDAEELARRVRSLGERGRARAAERRVAERAGRWRRRRRGMAWALVVLSLLVIALAVMTFRVSREAAKTRVMSDLLVEMIQRGDPFAPWLVGESQAEASAATLVNRRILNFGVSRLPEFDDQPEVRARLTHAFGTALLRLGHYEEAAALLEQALALVDRLGDAPAARHEITLDLAEVWQAQGRPDDAEALYRQVLATLRGQKSEGDLAEQADVLSSIALTRQAQKALEEAEALFRRVLDTRRQVLEPGHYQVGISLNNLAGVLQARGDLVAAEPFYRQALEPLRASLGEEHPLVADIFNNLAGVHQVWGDLDAAESLYLRALEVRRKTLGSSHSRVADSLNNLAWLHVARGEPQVAEPLIQEALAIYRKALPADHWRIPNAESILAATFSESGRFAEAEDLLLVTYPKIREGAGERSQYTRDVLQRLIRLYDLWEKPAEAAAFRERWVASGGKASPSMREPDPFLQPALNIPEG